MNQGSSQTAPSTTRLLWAVHSHQPVGNFDFVFENAFRNAYGPFVDVLERHPSIGVDFHFSGILLDWLDKNRPEFLERVAALVRRGQCGLLAGAYHEPILPPIPRHDQVGQIRALADRLEKRFGVRPRGMWLAERVWEPGLPSALADAGMEFTLLDGTHFAQVGFGEDAMSGRWLTESDGKTISVFPIHDRVRDLVPFASVEEAVAALKALAVPGGRDIVFGDDGEKFGDWPGTHELCYVNGWLERFFSAVEQDPSLSVRPVSEAFAEGAPARGMAYLPAASYFEMMEWAESATRQSALRRVRERLKADGSWEEARPFVRGVSWRNFLVRYPESNRMHKMASRISFAIEHELSGKVVASRRKALLAARDHVWQAQCNCGYWHGVFGGLYLPHLRRAIHGHLARAEHIVRGDATTVERVDWDLDGVDEVLLANGEQFLSIHPGQGGAVPVWYLSMGAINLSDSMTRRPEAYHARVSGEEGRADGGKLADQFEGNDPELARLLQYDDVPRVSGLSWWFPDDVPSEAWFDRDPAHWIGGVWEVRKSKVHRGVPTAVLASRRGDLLVERRTSLRESGVVETTIVLENAGSTPLRGRFGAESMLNFLAGEAHDRWLQPAGGERSMLGTTGEALGTSLAVSDEWLQVDVLLEGPDGTIAWQGIHTVNQSVGGYEKVYQGTSVLQIVPVELAPGESRTIVLRAGVHQRIESPL